MIDFGGWASNWDWSGYSHGELPHWIESVLVIPTFVAAGCIVLSYNGVGEAGIWWTLGALGAALIIEFVTRSGFDEPRLVLVSYWLSTIFGGVLALVALRMSDGAPREGFAVAAQCLVFAFGPITSRAVAATCFSLRMVDYAKNQGDLARAALAGEGSALVVRAEGIAGEDLSLTTVGEAAGQKLTATLQALRLQRQPSTGTHFLLEAPRLGDTETIGYRGESARRRVLAVERAHYLGQKPETLRAGYYWDEVRAGIVFVLVEHSILFGIAWVLAHWVR
jgi:hypothetical protein